MVALAFDFSAFFYTEPAAAQTFWSIPVPREITIPADFAGASGEVHGNNPASSYVITVKDDGTTIGTVTISNTGVFTFATTGGTAKTVAAGSRLTFEAPNPVDGTIGAVYLGFQSTYTETIDSTDLGDMPGSYNGDAGKILAVKGDETGLEYIVAPSGGGGGGGSDEILHVQHTTTGATHADGTAGQVNTRTLNNVVSNNITGASVASDQITLPAGTYLIDAAQVHMRAGGAKGIFYNVTDDVDALVGIVGWQDNDTSGDNGIVTVRGVLALAAEKDFELRMYYSANYSTYNMGYGVNDGRDNVFADVLITKVA